MGFPVGYWDLVLPRFLFFLLSFLGHLGSLISFALRAAGLGNLLLDPADAVQPSSYDPPPRPRPDHRIHHHVSHGAAARIRSLLPVARYGDLGGGAAGDADASTEGCAVCLHEFGCEDEVRQLSNCRHVFHRGCIDPWVDLDQRTCPLCRAAIVPEGLLWGGGGPVEVDWGSGPAGDGDGESLYPLADQLRFVAPEPIPWFLLPSDAAAAAAFPDLELW